MDSTRERRVPIQFEERRISDSSDDGTLPTYESQEFDIDPENGENIVGETRPVGTRVGDASTQVSLGIQHGSILFVEGMHGEETKVESLKEAEKVADDVLEELETEVYDFMKQRGETFAHANQKVKYKKKKRRIPVGDGHKLEPIRVGPVEFVPGMRAQDVRVPAVHDAQEVADAVLDELEFELDDFFRKHNLVEKKPAHGRQSEAASIKSSLLFNTGMGGKYALDEPSTMDLFYEKGDAGDLRMKSLTAPPEESRADAECQGRIHRRRLSQKTSTKSMLDTTDDSATQTMEMTFMPQSNPQAELIFRHMYPRPENYQPPTTASRKESMEENVETAKSEDPDVDRVQVGPKVKWNAKPRLLPPLPQDYHKVESFWTGSTFTGKYVGRQFEHGFFNYPLMSTYESEFKQGVIQTKKHQGLVVYPRGDTFEGSWSRGRYMAGRITFEDGLVFHPQNWDYLAQTDRRFLVEHDVGVKQAGRTLYSNFMPPVKIPPGMYDTCDGVYNPDTKVVTAYNGMKLRTVEKAEHEFILAHCRKTKLVQERHVSEFNTNRLPGSYVDTYACGS